MKTTLIPTLLAALAFLMAAPLHAAAADGSAFCPGSSTSAHNEVPVDSVAARVHANGDMVTRGTTRIMVSMRLGSPNAVLPDGSWLYRGYTAHALVEQENGARLSQQPMQTGTLIVRFSEGKVTSVSLADTFNPKS